MSSSTLAAAYELDRLKSVISQAFGSAATALSETVNQEVKVI